MLYITLSRNNWKSSEVLGEVVLFALRYNKHLLSQTKTSEPLGDVGKGGLLYNGVEPLPPVVHVI
jgi:hypothetical protein